ncbi:hypothetical protein CJU89_5242 [Yarrowia sp. B02]|nr:hypothetical protein CJU89_5242 [Yarrowia sp. B02]
MAYVSDKTNAEDAGSEQDRLDRAWDLVSEWRAECVEVDMACDEKLANFDKELEKLQPKIRPSSKEVCLDAADEFYERHYNLVSSLAKPRKQLARRKACCNQRKFRAHGMYDRLQLDEGRRMSREELATVCRMRDELVWKGEDALKEKQARKYRRAVKGSSDDLALQVQLHKMMEGQSEEVRDWVLIHNNRFSPHLSRRSTRPRKVADKITQEVGALHVPPEVASIIYSFCDLESAVNLREVNHSLYSAYHGCEKTLREIVRSRFPWMHLEEDMRTWADCCLVHAKRISGGKWTPTKDLDMLTHRYLETPVQQLYAPELKPGQKCPEGFVHFEAFARPPVLGEVKTHTNEEGETVVNFAHLEITLPAGIVVSAAQSLLPVQVRREHIVVRSTTRVFVVPTDSPHYKSGFSYIQNPSRECFNVGQDYATVTSETVDENNKYKRQYSFWKGEGNTFREYGFPTESAPVASYNGLIWWLIQGVNIVPTFIDPMHPRQIFIRKEKMVKIEKSHAYEFFQCAKNKQGANRFLINTNGARVLLIDLATSTVTELKHTRGEQETRDLKLVPGFVKGSFDARFMAKETYDKFMVTQKESRIEAYMLQQLCDDAKKFKNRSLETPNG